MQDDLVAKEARWVKVSAVIPADLYIVWDSVVTVMQKRGIDHDSEVIRNGMVLEVLCADYLASKR